MFDEKLYLQICKEYDISFSNGTDIIVAGKVINKENGLNLILDMQNDSLNNNKNTRD